MAIYTEQDADGKMKTYTSSERFLRKFFSWVVIIALLFVLLVLITIKNLVSFDVIRKFGVETYLHNIKGLHRDSVIILHKETLVFPKKSTIKDAESGAGSILKLSSGQLLLQRAEYGNDSSTWVAIEAFDGDKSVAGWIWGAGKKSDGGGLWRTLTDNEIAELNREALARAIDASKIKFIRINKGLDYEKKREDADFLRNYVEINDGASFLMDSDRYVYFAGKDDVEKYKSLVSMIKSGRLSTQLLIGHPPKIKGTVDQVAGITALNVGSAASNASSEIIKRSCAFDHSPTNSELPRDPISLALSVDANGSSGEWGGTRLDNVGYDPSSNSWNASAQSGVVKFIFENESITLKNEKTGVIGVFKCQS